MNLTNIEAYAMARFGIGEEWGDLQVGPLLRQMLTNATQKDSANLLRLLGPEVARQVLAVDPCGPAPANARRTPDQDDPIPALPDSVKFTPEQALEADAVGQWERDFTHQIGAMLNETPYSFIQYGALWMTGLAIGRRLFVRTSWGEEFYPNQYGILVSVSTYYHKSTILKLIARIIFQAMPHMIISRPGSAENFTRILAGKIDTDDSSTHEKSMANRALPFAAQRGLIRDEISALFCAMQKDFMAGMKEALMEMYDAPDYISLSTNGKGLSEIRNAAFSLLGGSTPASLSRTLTVTEWESGNIARMALIAPESDYKDRPLPTALTDLSPFVLAISKLHNELPAPPDMNALGDIPEEVKWQLFVPETVQVQINAYHQALRQMTAESAPIDNRLRPWYGRQPARAIKVMITLAALDWICNPKRPARPVIQPGHWYRAVQIAEVWRESIHKSLRELGRTDYSRSEQRVRSLLSNWPEGLTRSALLKKAEVTARELDDVLNNMMDAGEAEMIEQKNTGGRSAKSYRSTFFV
jgi:hypothetical protein